MTYNAFTALVLIPLSLLGCAGLREVPPRQETISEANGCDLLLDPARSTFVLHEVNTGRTSVCNRTRSATRFIPASTFKIPHAIAALESGVVTDENAAFAWDGQPRGVTAWDRDTSLAEGIASSTVWVFQTIASRLGHAREAAWVRRLDYGNADVGTSADLRHFWLSGPLAISAVEQVRFLRRLRESSLSVSKDVQSQTAAMLRMRDCGDGCALYGKTGAMLPIDNEGFLRATNTSLLPVGVERTGWFVGWVERPARDGGPIVFAHNLDLSLPNAMAGRTQVTYRILAANGIASGIAP